MIFKNAFHLLVDNFKLNYKMLLYKLVAAVITLALGAALLYPTLNALVTSAPFRELADLLGSFFKAVVSGNTEFLSTFSETLQGKVSALLAFLQENTPNIVLFFVLFAVVVLVHRFLDGIGNFVFGCLLDDKMSSCADTRFFGSYISNLGKAALWQVVYVPVTFDRRVLRFLFGDAQHHFCGDRRVVCRAHAFRRADSGGTGSQTYAAQRCGSRAGFRQNAPRCGIETRFFL